MSSANSDILKCLCRLCAKQDKHCVNVFSNDGNKHFIQKKIRLCLPITVKEDDVMPRQICLSCLNKLDTCYELYSRCVTAQSTIKKLIESESTDETITDISSSNPLIKVRKATQSGSTPIKLNSTVSLQDYLRRGTDKPAEECPRIKVRKLETENTSNAPLTEEISNDTSNINRRKSCNTVSQNNASTTVSTPQQAKTNASTPKQSKTNLDTPISKQLPSVCESTKVNTPPVDSPSTQQTTSTPRITHLQSLAKPTVSSYITPTQSSQAFSVATAYVTPAQSMNCVQSPQNMVCSLPATYITSPACSVGQTSQSLAGPITSTYVTPQTLVQNPLIASTYLTSPPVGSNEPTPSSNYVIQPQLVNTGTASAPHFVLMNSFDSGNANYAVTLTSNNKQVQDSSTQSPTSNPKQLPYAQDWQPNNGRQKKQSPAMQNVDRSAKYQKLVPKNTAAATFTSSPATSCVSVGQSPVISNVKSLQTMPMKTYENVRNSQQTSAGIQSSLKGKNVINVPISSSSSAIAAKGGSVPQEAVSKQNSLVYSNNNTNALLHNLLQTSNSSGSSETYSQSVKNGNNPTKRMNRNSNGTVAELNSQVSIQIPSKQSDLTNALLSNKNFDIRVVPSKNLVGNVQMSQSSPNVRGPPPTIPITQGSNNAARQKPPQKSIVSQQPSSVRTQYLPSTTSTVTNATVTNGPNSLIGNGGQTRPATSKPNNSTPARLVPQSVTSASLTKTTSASSTQMSQNTPVLPSGSRPSVGSVPSPAAVSVASTNASSSSIPAAEGRSLATQMKSEIIFRNDQVDLKPIVSDLPTSSTDISGTVKDNGPVDQSNQGATNNDNVCPYCHKEFPPDILIHHKVLHFRERFFTCIDCGKNFCTEAGLEKHRCEPE